MAAEVEAPVKEERYDHKAKRTQAVPKHTLFGSVIERLDDDEMVSMKKINIKEIEKRDERDRQVKRDKYKPKLPPSLQGRVRGNEVLEMKKTDFVKQVKEASRARNLIDTLEEQSKYFAVGSHLAAEPESERNYTGRKHQWMTEKDLAHAKDINILGLNGKNYNRDKYGDKPPVHQYSVIGDPLKLGMDFAPNNAAQRRAPPRGSAPQHMRDPDWQPREHYMFPADASAENLPTSAISLPPNIQHQFGTKICNHVLADREKIDDTIRLHKQIHDSCMRTRGRKQDARAGSVCTTDPQYEQLGGALRQNMFPGYTYNHKRSLARSVYTDDVHTRRYNDPEQYRYQRDALSTWNEFNVIYLRQKKKWDEYADNAPKFAANWDRNATRPPPPPKTADPKPKPKPKAKPKAKEEKPAFEPVVFETPPQTPPPPRLEPPPTDQGNKRDDEFWDFYNKQ